MFPKEDKLFWHLVSIARKLNRYKYSWGEHIYTWSEIRKYLLGYKFGYWQGTIDYADIVNDRLREVNNEPIHGNLYTTTME